MNWNQILTLLAWLGYNLGLLAGGAGLALVAHTILLFILRRITRRTSSPADELVVNRCAAPARWIMMTAGLWLALELTTFSEGVESFLRHLVSVVFVVLVGWLLIRLLQVGTQILLGRFDVAKPDNLRARAVHTQVKVFERIVISVVVVIGFGCVLMTFEGVRQLGVSLLASAGIVGIILGLAAQKALGTLFSGMQLAIAQPIRLDDIVIVEGESGVIEEITLTYVVVRLWDLRRLVVPTNYFLEKPFQNWTRVSSDLLGTVFLYVDAAAPVEPIRAELERLLKEAPEWDQRVWKLQVTNVNDRTVELRALMSAGSAAAAFDLRCKVREQLLAFIRSKCPEAMPRLRVEGAGLGLAAAGSQADRPAGAEGRAEAGI